MHNDEYRNVLSERSQTQKTMYCITPFIWHARKAKPIVTEDRLMGAWGQGLWHETNFRKKECFPILIIVTWSIKLHSSNATLKNGCIGLYVNSALINVKWKDEAKISKDLADRIHIGCVSRKDMENKTKLTMLQGNYVNSFTSYFLVREFKAIWKLIEWYHEHLHA